MYQQMLDKFRCAQRTSLPRLCVVVVVAMGLVVLADLVPRMVIVTSQPRETAYWEAWEEAYVDRRARATAFHIAPVDRPHGAMADGVRLQGVRGLVAVAAAEGGHRGAAVADGAVRQEGHAGVPGDGGVPRSGSACLWRAMPASRASLRACGSLRQGRRHVSQKRVCLWPKPQHPLSLIPYMCGGVEQCAGLQQEYECPKPQHP